MIANHQLAFDMVFKTCPNQMGVLWKTTQDPGCDTAWAVYYQYDLDDPAERRKAKRALEVIANGFVPKGWELFYPNYSIREGQCIGTCQVGGDVYLEARAKAFDCDGVCMNRFIVKADGTVQVYDDVAGHYTTCHSMKPAALRRIRRLAKEVQDPATEAE